MGVKGVRAALVLCALGVGAAVVLSGCSTLGSAMSAAIGSQSAKSSDSAKSAEPAETSTTASPAPSQSSAGPAVAYQYQFNAFYSGFWNMGWFGYQDPNYKPGQGTVWEISSTGGKAEKVSFERALLKINPDGSQWWRFTFTSAKDTIIYEFLVGSDKVVQKVRYKDPKSGEIGEFVPSQNNQPPMTPQVTRDQIASSLVGTESVTVPAGTFTADHYRYTDKKSGYTSESWISKQVPGYMVKFVGTNPQNTRVSTGQLVKIESGVTTELQSY